MSERDSTASMSTTPAGEQPGRWRLLWNQHRGMLADVFTAFIVSRFIFYSVGLLALYAIPLYAGDDYTPRDFPTHPIIDMSWRWDSGWYEDIARNGYELSSEEESSVAFFPLFPLLLGTLFRIIPGMSLYLLGVLLNHAIFFLALIPVWLYAARFGGRPVAQRTLLLLVIFPTAFFFNAVYTEALFLLLSGAALLAIQRLDLRTGGLIGFAASLTRPTGVLLAIPFGIRLWQRAGWDIRALLRHGWPIVLIPLGVAVFSLYLAIRFGEPLAFMDAQDAWGHTTMSPITALVESFRLLIETEVHDIFFVMNGVNTFLTVAALLMTVVLVRSDLMGAAWCSVAILIPLSGGIESMPTISMGRYVLVLFPLLIPLARWAASWSVQALLIAAFLPTHVVLLALFVRWYWVV